jgi:Fe-S-cluster containining protein
MKNPSAPSTILKSLQQLYKSIDNRAEELARIHEKRLKCRQGCHTCCVDDLSVFQVEADNIASHFSKLLQQSHPHAKGVCAFINEQGACRIYGARPYVCRTQGLPLQWIEEEHGKSFAMRDICPLNDEGNALETLPEEECWQIGPAEEALAKLQYAAYKGMLSRVKIRDLFGNS